MRRCVELAEIAAFAGDTAVGALIVCGGEVVGEGVERTQATLDPSAHAEWKPSALDSGWNDVPRHNLL